LREKIILMHKQFATQLALFAIFAIIFWKFFSDIFIDLWFIKLSWIIIYILFSSLSYYALQVFYEFYSGNTLFASEEEVRKYLEKLENDNL